MNTKIIMTILLSLTAFAFTSKSMAQNAVAKNHPTTGVYQLAKTISGTCLDKIKIYFSPEVDQLDVLGLQPGQIVFQMANINQGQKTYPIRNEKKEIVGMHTATSLMSENTIEYKILTQNKFGYAKSSLDLKANFNPKTIAIAGRENDSKPRPSDPIRTYSCVYNKM